jgi:GTP-binding protein EngB required for normal cell division
MSYTKAEQQTEMALERPHGLVSIIDQLTAFTRDRGNERLAADSSELAAKLDQARFNLVVLGEFKRGKSTFINALLGEDLLPTAVIPLTSVVTVVGYDDTPQATVGFVDGFAQEVELSSISDYITESGNPENGRGVKLVEIGFPSDFLLGGVRIVDTPGTGSVHEHNTQATLDYLPEADALIFLLTADQPASREELDLLHKARSFTPRFFIVQNKIDYLDDEQRLESMRFLNKTLSRELNESPRIYAVSALNALQRQHEKAGEFDALRGEIRRFLLEERGDVLIQNVTARLGRLLEGAAGLIRLESKMAAMSSEAIQAKISSFRSSAEQIASTQREAEYLLRADTNDLILRIDGDLKKFAQSRREQAIAQIEVSLETNTNLNNLRLVELLRGLVREQIERTFKEWREQEEEAVAESFEKITGKFTERANVIAGEIALLTKELFGVELATQFVVEPLTTKSRLYYYTEDPFDYQFSRIRLLLPNRLERE